MGSFHVTQQNFLVICSEPCCEQNPGERDEGHTSCPIGYLGLVGESGAHNPNELRDKADR